MDGLLTFSHGSVRLGSSSVPGILKSLRVRGSVLFDEAEVDGLSGTTKTPKGWEDAAVTLVVELLTDDTGNCYDKLTRLDALFRGLDNNANPKVLDVANPHITARGVERVVFAGLNSTETDADDVVEATLRFTEHRPVVLRAEKQVATRTSVTSPGLDPRVGERSR